MRSRNSASLVMFASEREAAHIRRLLEGTIRNSDELFELASCYAILMGHTPGHEALRAVSRYQAATASMVDLRFGVASYPQDGKDSAEIVAAALRYLWMARGMDRGAVVFGGAQTGAPVQAEAAANTDKVGDKK